MLSALSGVGHIVVLAGAHVLGLNAVVAGRGVAEATGDDTGFHLGGVVVATKLGLDRDARVRVLEFLDQSDERILERLHQVLKTIVTAAWSSHRCSWWRLGPPRWWVLEQLSRQQRAQWSRQRRARSSGRLPPAPTLGPRPRRERTSANSPAR